MKHKIFTLLTGSPLIILFTTTACTQDEGNAPITEHGLSINHTCTELSQIPVEWIDSVQTNIKLHYAHISHGGQLTTGLNRIESSNSAYNVAIGSSQLPNESDAFCIFDGQESVIYITPDLYWRTAEGMNYRDMYSIIILISIFPCGHCVAS